MSFSEKRRQHRWKDSETRLLLELIKKAQPTARTFYTRHCQKKELKYIPWNIMKHKIRHLKAFYVKARSWKDQVGAQIFKSDKELFDVRILNICPFYTLLDSIFSSTIPVDPIKVINVKNYNTSLLDATDDSFDNFNDEYIEIDNIVKNTNSDIVLKQEIDNDDNNDNENNDVAGEEVAIIAIPRKNHKCKNIEKTELEKYLTEVPVERRLHKIKIEIEREKLELERKKLSLETHYKCKENDLKHLQLSFEKEKLDLEKRNSLEEQRLQKYEIDKQFEIKKMEIEKNERLMCLELQYKYNMNNDMAVYE